MGQKDLGVGFGLGSVCISKDEWLAALKEVHEAPLPPTGALSVGEIGELLGIGRSGALARIKRLVAKGLAEPTTKLVRRGTGLCRVPAYVLKKDVK